MVANIKALIVDDEKPARDELSFLLKKHFDNIEIVHEFDNTKDTYDYLLSNDCDLLFLDIEMPVESGIEFAHKMNKSIENLPYIIFITAYDKFAVEAFDLDAVDYLLKPVRDERLKKSIEKMSKRNIKVEDFNVQQFISSISKKNNTPQIITVSAGDKLIPINFKEIIYATVDDKLTYLFTLKGRFQYSGTLQELNAFLDDGHFFRTHKSFIINLSMVENVDLWFNGTFKVKLANATNLVPVSRNNVKSFKKILNIR